MLGTVETYVAPDWARTLSFIPKKRVHLMRADTPIHKWMVPGAPPEFNVSIKRDDLTGSTLSGNKVRNLEFLMADALERGSHHVITCGGVQSNHCRAVVVAARQLGLKPHIILRTHITDVKDVGCNGNLLLDRLCGANIYLVPPNYKYLTHISHIMDSLAQQIKSSTGEDSYLIPLGGADKTGVFGYIQAFEEMRQQGVLDEVDDLVFACGSGGTAAGLMVGNYFTGQNLRLHAIAPCDDKDHFYNCFVKILADVGLGHLTSRNLMRLVVHGGKGYDLSTSEELDFIQQVATQTGIFVDPVYSGKAALSMVREMQKTPAEFKGRRVLFLHTGGIFGLFDGRMTAHLEQKPGQQSQIRMWSEEEGGLKDSNLRLTL